ncbi:hypothetical protein ACNKHO_22210 [Shigella flexneri]
MNRDPWDEKTAVIVITTGGVKRCACLAASIVPLYVGMATHEQAGTAVHGQSTPSSRRAASLPPRRNREQWDKPNGGHCYSGWLFVGSSSRYGNDSLGDEIALEPAAHGELLLQNPS